tara:strand:+ start:118 stop:399 length:282 start_codon:yes stop_codon:yes gene_type:complete
MLNIFFHSIDGILILYSKCRTIRINDFLRYILQIDKELPENKKGQIPKNMSLSRLVEKRGVKSNYFGMDLTELSSTVFLYCCVYKVVLMVILK